MTATVNFEAPQLKVDNGTTGIAISQVILPYSIRNNEDTSQYLGGQTVLTKEDGVALTDNTADWYKKALVKIKGMVASTEIYITDESQEGNPEAETTTEVEQSDTTSEADNAEVKTEQVTTDAVPAVQ